ncbi:hypothetical protein F0L74_22490 [Chitinophaga agrisoli]|uniref:Uncharacterized protein n=1 Tax=Chitinophaga agrisoli TaxID=2607653 RepID=A0A5B2VKC8_9BACT|nr:hypothetical protein [Chitinophaga agrisoli]KAA2238986.1 hypothetical protein F0L74_22490 [Chitinophaga agrisoli]
MELQLKITGILMIALALLHVIFPRYFNWKQELMPLSVINREMMYVHAFFIALTVLLMGLLCLTSAGALLGTALGRRICLGFALFWMARLCIQFFGYSSRSWKGKRFETAVHVAFSFLWLYLSGVFMFTYLG